MPHHYLLVYLTAKSTEQIYETLLGRFFILSKIYTQAAWIPHESSIRVGNASLVLLSGTGGRLQILPGFEPAEAGLNLGGRIGGHLLPLTHQESPDARLDLGRRFVLQWRRHLLGHPWGPLHLGTPRRGCGTPRRPRGASLAHLLAYPIAAESGLDLGGGVVLRLGRIGRTRMDVHLVHYRFQTVYEGVQRGPLIVFQRDCFG